MKRTGWLIFAAWLLLMLAIGITLCLNKAKRLAELQKRSLARQEIERQSDALRSARISQAGIEEDVHALRSELDALAKANAAIQKEIDRLQAEIPVVQDEVTHSFGKVRDLGRELSGQISVLIELVEPRQSPELAADTPQLTPEQQRSVMKMMQTLSQLRELEDDPKEAAAFQAGVLGRFYQMPAGSVRRMETVLEREFTTLITQKLQASQKPADNPEEWITRRDAAIASMAQAVRPLLPAQSAQGSSNDYLPSLLNLCEGFRTRVEMREDGHGSMQLYLPGFAPL